jgi:hypothetical protein
MVSRRIVARRRPGWVRALQPWGLVFVTAGVVQGVAQAAKSCPSSHARARGGGCGSSLAGRDDLQIGRLTRNPRYTRRRRCLSL